MLCSRPARAQRPTVPGVKWTLEAASSRDASSRLIQSEGGRGIAQPAALPPLEPDEPDELVPVLALDAPGAADDPADSPLGESDAPAPPDPVDPSAPRPEPSAPSPAAFDLRAGADPRSLRAQPEPLKTTAGGANALRIGPPQTGQVDGPWPWTPWTTSMRWPQDEQT